VERERDKSGEGRITYSLAPGQILRAVLWITDRRGAFG